MIAGVFIGYLGSGGAEKVAIANANALASSGHIVYFFKLKADQEYYLNEINQEVKLVTLKSRSLSSCIFEFRRLVRELKIQCVFSHMTDENIISSISLMLLNVKHIGYEHNSLEEIISRPKVKAFITIMLMLLTYPLLHNLIVVSNGLRNHFRKFIRYNKIIAIYNPVVCKNKSVPSLWDKMEGKLRIAFVGRNCYQKNFERCLELFYQLKKSFNSLEITLNVYGSGYDEENQIDGVVYHGHIDKSKIYSMNDALLLTSRYEGFGNVVCEAVEYGCFPLVQNVNYGPDEIISLSYGKVFTNYQELQDMVRNGWSVDSVNLKPFTIEEYDSKINDVFISCMA